MAYRRRYYKRRFKKSRYIKRTYGSRRKVSRYSKMFRRYQKPELKWIDSSNSHTINSGSFASFYINAINVVEGTGQDNRIGNRVKFLRFRYHFQFITDNLGTYTLPYQRVRVIMWNPKIDAATVVGHMQGLSDSLFPDPNIATVYMDRTFNVYQINANQANVEPTKSEVQLKQFAGFIPFPRNVSFPNGSSLVSLDFKDQIGITIICTGTGGPQVSFRYRTRTTYVDT